VPKDQRTNIRKNVEIKPKGNAADLIRRKRRARGLSLFAGKGKIGN